MNLAEIFQALLDGKKLYRTFDKIGSYIYMKDSRLYNENGISLYMQDLAAGPYYEYIEPVKTKKIKYYILSCLDERHIVCAFSKKEARQSMHCYDTTYPLKHLWLNRAHATCVQLKVNCNKVII